MINFTGYWLMVAAFGLSSLVLLFHIIRPIASGIVHQVTEGKVSYIHVFRWFLHTERVSLSRDSFHIFGKKLFEYSSFDGATPDACMRYIVINIFSPFIWIFAFIHTNIPNNTIIDVVHNTSAMLAPGVGWIGIVVIVYASTLYFLRVLYKTWDKVNKLLEKVGENESS